MKSLLGTGLAFTVLAGSASAQLPESSSFAVEGLVLGTATGGGASSVGVAAFPAVQAAGATDLASAGFTAEVGFLGAFDPLDVDRPLVFAITPSFGPMEGGTPITVHGLGLDDPSVTLGIDGQPATGVIVDSGTQLSAVSPIGDSGPHGVEVQTSLGADTFDDGFVHTPAILVAPFGVLGCTLETRNFGPVGGLFRLYFSFSTGVTPLPPYGTLLLGPNPAAVFSFGPLGVYPGPDGVLELDLNLITNPALAGSTVYWQTLSIVSLVPVDIRLTNAQATALYDL